MQSILGCFHGFGLSFASCREHKIFLRALLAPQYASAWVGIPQEACQHNVGLYRYCTAS